MSHRTTRRRSSAAFSMGSWRSVYGIVGCVAVLPASVRAEPSGNIRGLTVDSYEIDVSLSPSSGELSARAVVRFKDARDATPPSGNGEAAQLPFVFYLHNELRIDALEIGGKRFEAETAEVPYDYSYTTKAMRVTGLMPSGCDLTRRMTVSYSGPFHPSSARSRSDYMRIDQDGVFLRGYAYSLWFPMFVESNTTSYEVAFPRVIIHTPEEFTPVFVGERVREDVSGNERVSEWRADHADVFAAQLTARRFQTTGGDGIFVYCEQGNASSETARAIHDFIAKLNETYAAHYDSRRRSGQIHVMEMPEFGDISSGNVIGLASDAWSGFQKQPRYKRFFAHELVHPFVGLQIGRSDPLYAMMVEGFPSYFHLPALAEIEGEQSYDEFLDRVEQRYLELKGTGGDAADEALPPEKPIYDIGADAIGAYKDVFVLNDRALLFFDYLRRERGKDAFWRFTKKMFDSERPITDHAAFEALIASEMGVAPADLAVWLRTADYPDRFRRKPPKERR